MGFTSFNFEAPEKPGATSKKLGEQVSAAQVYHAGASSSCQTLSAPLGV